MNKQFFVDNRYKLLFLFIVLIGLGVRLYPLQYNTFAEPDVYMYYSVAQQTLTNHFIITTHLSGVPLAKYSEKPLLILVPVVITFLTGISLRNIFMFLPVVFGVLGIIITYLLLFKFGRNKKWALFGAFVYSVVPASLYRSSVGMWRGEVFVPIFIAFGMWFLIRAFEGRKWNVLGLVALTIISLLWWKGGVYVLIPISLFIISWISFRLLQKFNWPDRNKNIIIALILVSTISILFFVGLIITPLIRSIGGWLNPQTFFIAELTPTTAGFILLFYGWVFVLSIIGIIWSLLYKSASNYDYVQYALLSLYITGFAMQVMAIRWTIIFIIPAIVYAIYGINRLLLFIPQQKKVLVFEIVFFLIIIVFIQSMVFMTTYQPADNLNPQFISSLNWLRNNTPTNSIVLTMWEDGSLVEGVGHRISITDSVFSQNGIRIVAFERWLYAERGNDTYINNSPADYLLVRYYWLTLTDAMKIEADINWNRSINNTNLQSLINKSAINKWAIAFQNNDTIIYRIK